MPVRVAHRDPALAATIVSRRPMRYHAGPHAALDRPAHLRAGSSLAWLDESLVVTQDDASFIALVNPATALADAITLPAGEGGLRQFDDARGNKRFKLDLEACFVVPGGTGPRLVALGSGSRMRRRRVVVVDAPHSANPSVSLVDATALYLALESATAFAGSDMNIEGALVLSDRLQLFGRGNSQARRGREPLNACCTLALPELLAYLAAPGEYPPPQPTTIVRYELGDIDGLALGFTDAALLGNSILYSAAAEESSTASDDGPVSGSAIGLLPADGPLRYAPLTDVSGEVLPEKVEGLAAVPHAPDRLYVVIDPDDHTRPSELCEARLSGPWR